MVKNILHQNGYEILCTDYIVTAMNEAFKHYILYQDEVEGVRGRGGATGRKGIEPFIKPTKPQRVVVTVKTTGQ